MSSAHVTVDTAREAVGALMAQQLIDDMRAGKCSAELAWLKFCELAACHSWKSAAACRSLVTELAKRAAGR